MSVPVVVVLPGVFPVISAAALVGRAFNRAIRKHVPSAFRSLSLAQAHGAGRRKLHARVPIRSRVYAKHVCIASWSKVSGTRVQENTILIAVLFENIELCVSWPLLPGVPSARAGLPSRGG